MRINGVLACLVLFAGMAFGQLDENWNGYGDTASATAFRADSTYYSGAFRLSTWENLRLTAYANDTSSAGFASDSVKFVWGIQTFHPCWTSTNRTRTYVYAQKILIDTFSLLSPSIAATINVTRGLMPDSSYSFTSPLGTIDTSNVSGYAYQTRNISPEWDVYFRFWATGLAGNKKSKFPKVVFEAARRNYVPGRQR